MKRRRPASRRRPKRSPVAGEAADASRSSSKLARRRRSATAARRARQASSVELPEDVLTAVARRRSRRGAARRGAGAGLRRQGARKHPGQHHPGLQQGPPALPVLPHRATSTQAKALAALDRAADLVDGRGARVRARLSARCAPRLGVRNPPMCATWVNIAFSHRAIALLAGAADAAAFGDQSFRQGLAARSTYLGDPDRRRARRPPHALGGRRPEERGRHPRHRRRRRRAPPGRRRSDAIKARAAASGLDARCSSSAATRCPGALRGHEHFGFKDGISQPGVRGKVSTAPGDFITPRYIDHADPRAKFFAKPGQLLRLAGPVPARRAAPAPGGPRRVRRRRRPTSRAGPRSAPISCAAGCGRTCRRSGSSRSAPRRALGMAPVQRGVDAGRPLAERRADLRSPRADNAALAGDEWANNHFIFDDDTRPSHAAADPRLRRRRLHAGARRRARPPCARTSRTSARAIRATCATDLGKPHDSMLRMILRRGIPFGPPIVGVKRPPRDARRGASAD